MIGHAVEQVSAAADRLATGTLADLTRAMRALSVGDLSAAKARADVIPVSVASQDEVGAMADSFNTMQREVGRTAEALDGAREGLRAAENKLEYQALHDPLTGLPNRILLADRLTQALARASRRGPVAVLFLDLDQFKLLNDSRGHRAGDELLQTVAMRLTTVMRPGDTVARFGGDEFCVVCDDVDDAFEAVAIAGRIIAELGRPYMLETGEHFATASLGIALADGSAYVRPAEDLIREADTAAGATSSSTRSCAATQQSGCAWTTTYAGHLRPTTS
jgi:diguanylate cyclase (GGDEF)-like protein